MRVSPNDVRLLVAEDDAMDYQLLKSALTQAGVIRAPVHFRDGAELLSFLRGAGARVSDPTVILMDLRMPRLDGLETLAQLKDDPTLSAIPVVILTTSPDEETVRHVYRGGASGYVSKPLKLEDFDQRIRAFVDFWLRQAELPLPDAAVGTRRSGP